MLLTNMPAKLQIFPNALLLKYIYRPDITVHISHKKTATFIYHAFAIYVPETNILPKCHIYATYTLLLDVCQWESMTIYMLHILSGINHVTRST